MVAESIDHQYVHGVSSCRSPFEPFLLFFGLEIGKINLQMMSVMYTE